MSEQPKKLSSFDKLQERLLSEASKYNSSLPKGLGYDVRLLRLFAYSRASAKKKVITAQINKAWNKALSDDVKSSQIDSFMSRLRDADNLKNVLDTTLKKAENELVKVNAELSKKDLVDDARKKVENKKVKVLSSIDSTKQALIEINDLIALRNKHLQS